MSLPDEGYVQTKAKYEDHQKRLVALEKKDLRPLHFEAVRRSYLDMMRQYLREIKLYEATVEFNARTAAPKGSNAEDAAQDQPDV